MDTIDFLNIKTDGNDNLFDDDNFDDVLISSDELLLENNENEKEENAVTEYTESDDHLPRVQEELDKLNYANESINNLELALEDSKKEYLELCQESEETLRMLEKKIGSCVLKAKPYYEALIELNEAREKYIKARNKFEASQALYVAAKEMQLYAEENLELNSSNKNLANPNRQTFIDILENSKIKAIESEKSKQLNDKLQIEAFKVYEEKQLFINNFEKKSKNTIEKSKSYYELKSSINKELKFQLSKIEGLKSCVKEAKYVYQQSLNNLEDISTEIHTQRQLTLNQSVENTNNTNSTNSYFCSSTDSSSANTEYLAFNFDQLTITSNSKLNEEISNYNDNNNNNSSHNQTNNDLNIKISEEQIANLSLDDKLDKYKKEIKLRPQFRTSSLLATKNESTNAMKK